MNAKTQDTEIPLADEHGVAITQFVAVAASMARNPLDELSIQLAAVVKAIKQSEANKPSGEITLTLKIRRAENVLDAVVIVPEVKSKLPKEPKFGTLLFADDDGVLSEQDPNQRPLFPGPRGLTE